MDSVENAGLVRVDSVDNLVPQIVPPGRESYDRRRSTAGFLVAFVPKNDRLSAEYDRSLH